MALYDSRAKGLAHYVRTSTPEHGRSFYFYQRVDPAAPRYVPNFGYEAGVYLKFIVDFYDMLPDVTVFVHARPWEHTKNWLRHIDCLRPNVTFAQVVFPSLSWIRVCPH